MSGGGGPDPALLRIFELEVAELVPEMQGCLLRIERGDPDAAEQLEDILRLAHDIKGSGRVVGYEVVGALAHALEDRLLTWRGADAVSATEVDLAIRTTDLLALLVRGGQQAGCVAEARQRIEQLRAAAAGQALPAPPVGAQGDGPAERAAPAEPASPVTRTAPTETVRVPRARLDRLVEGVAEVLADSFAAQARIKSLNAALRSTVSAETPGQQDEDLSRDRFALRKAVWELRGTLNLLDEHARDLAEHSRELRLVPVSRLFLQLERVARDTARRLGREVWVRTEGQDAHLDDLLIVALKGPLTHLVRNAVDHGLEPPEERVRKGKPREGVITLQLEDAGGRVMMSVADDGRGIDVEAVRLRLGPNGAHLDEARVLDALLHAGISTREETTQISGRGIGVTAATAAVERLGGELSLLTTPGRGSRFVLSVPTRLSVVRGLVVEAGGIRLLVPLRGLDEVRDPEDEVPSLASVLGRLEERRPASVVRLKTRDGMLDAGVDAVLGVEEVVRRPLGAHLGRVPYAEGAAILPTGGPALILDVRAVAEELARRGAERPAPPLPEPERGRRVLLADDSPTMRASLSSVLRAAGYAVTAVESGAAALDALRQETFDAVVTDHQMASGDGFTVLAACAGRMPALMITAFPDEERRRRAREAGAVAYLVKGPSLGQRVLETLEPFLSPHPSGETVP